MRTGLISCLAPVCAGMGQVQAPNGRCSSAIQSNSVQFWGFPGIHDQGSCSTFHFTAVYGDRISVLQPFGICLTLPPDFPSKWLPSCIPALWIVRSQPIQFENCFLFSSFLSLSCSQPSSSLQPQLKSAAPFTVAFSSKSTVAKSVGAFFWGQKGTDQHGWESWLKLNLSLDVSNPNVSLVYLWEEDRASSNTRLWKLLTPLPIWS